MNIIFCGTPRFAIPCLNSLLESPHKILAAVTQPDRPAGRGRQLQQSAVKEAAIKAGLPVLQPQRIGDIYDELKSLNPDVIAVVAFGQLLPKKILDLPKYGCINVHASLLPAYRGAAPINWAIIRGETQTGITTMRLDEGMDTGDMILKEAIAIDPQETAGTLHDKLAPIGARLLMKTLEEIENGTAVYTPQKQNEASYAPSIKKTDTMIDWKQPAEKIDCLVRGLNPFPSAKAQIRNEIFKIYKIDISNENVSAPPSTIIKCDKKDGILIATGGAPVWIKILQPPNRSIMNATEYLAGANFACREEK